MGHTAARATRSYAPRRDSVKAPENATPGRLERETASLLEAIGHMAAKAMWPMERIGRVHHDSPGHKSY